MYFKELIFCASVIFVQMVYAQCGCNQIIQTPNYGSRTRFTPYAVSLTVSPYPLPDAPYIPAEMSIESDNLLISGPVFAAGKLPFAGTVGLEGALPASGAGAVKYSCGDLPVITEVPDVISSYGSYNCGYGRM